MADDQSRRFEGYLSFPIAEPMDDGRFAAIPVVQQEAGGAHDVCLPTAGYFDTEEAAVEAAEHYAQQWIAKNLGHYH